MEDSNRQIRYLASCPFTHCPSLFSTVYSHGDASFPSQGHTGEGRGTARNGEKTTSSRDRLNGAGGGLPGIGCFTGQVGNHPAFSAP